MGSARVERQAISLNILLVASLNVHRLTLSLCGEDDRPAIWLAHHFTRNFTYNHLTHLTLKQVAIRDVINLLTCAPNMEVAITLMVASPCARYRDTLTAM